MKRIDAHQHFWQYDPVRDTWIDESMAVLKRDFMPGDLRPLLLQNKVDGCVAVQADQSEAETQFLLELAETHSFITGVVGWTDLMAPGLASNLDKFSGYNKLKGFRHIVQAEPEGFMSNESFQKGIATLASAGYTYDLLIREAQLKEAESLLQKLPEVPVVIDHIAKPSIASGSIDPWRKHMKGIAGLPHVFVKLSGMVTEADWGSWTYEDLLPYMEITLELFGADRIMFGSDWPVCTLAGKYEQVVETTERFTTSLSPSEQEHIWGLNCAKFYGL